ncbi:MAG: hypothetical protein DIU78_015660 [Pseudomonadota bacterium]
MKTLAMLTTALATLGSLATANAQPVSRAPADEAARAAGAGSSPHVDAEVDPTAYVLDGYSLHVGVGYERLRVDLGAYAMKLPAFVHGHDDLDVSFDGFGIKLQYFPFAEQTGGFVGVDAGLARPLVAKPAQQLAERHTEVAVGVNFGWRFHIVSGFYATTWLGLGYTLNPHDVTLGDSKYEAIRFTVFPAVHLGHQFL